LFDLIEAVLTRAQPGQDTQDALRSLAAADAASKSLSAASGIALVRAYGARSAVDVSSSA